MSSATHDQAGLRIVWADAGTSEYVRIRSLGSTCTYTLFIAYKYRKSYERECISGFMSTSDVLKVLKIARAVGECNLRTFKTSRVTINPEMHEQVHTIFYLLYIQQNYSFALLCTPYVPHQKHFNGFPNTHMFYLNQSKI